MEFPSVSEKDREGIIQVSDANLSAKRLRNSPSHAQALQW